MCHVAEHAEPVVHRDDDQPLLCERLAVVGGNRAGPFVEPATVQEEQHRPSLRRRAGRRPDVQKQAVFADRAVCHELVGPWIALLDDQLHAVGAELIGLSHATPGGRGLRSTPAQITDGRRGERNALVDHDRRVHSRHAGEQACCDADRLALGRKIVRQREHDEGGGEDAAGERL